MDLEDVTVHEPAEKAAKKSYTKRIRRPPTIASLNEEIEQKRHELEEKQIEIDTLIAKRNELYVINSETMGLIDIIADPEKAEWLAKLVRERCIT